MRSKILCFAIWALILSIPSYAAENQRLDHECILFVIPGDSYIRLFGRDWLRVFEGNTNMTFYDKQGNLTHSPEKLVVGTRLVVPTGTYMTERAMERLSRYEDIKKAAFQSIREAEAFVSQASQSNSQVYQQGLNLLGKAKEAAKGLTFGFANFIEARRLALEAIRCFKIDADLRKADRDMEQLKNRVEKERITANRQIGMLYQQRMAFLGLAIVVFLSFLWLMRHKKKKEVVVRIEGWLDQHLSRVESLEKAKI